MADPALAPAFAYLDMALRLSVLRFRAVYELSQDEFHGLYVSDRQVDALLDRQGAGDRFRALAGEKARLYHPALEAIARHPRWAALVGAFGLRDIEALAVFFALAPEYGPRYATLYAYLQNDVRRRWLTPALFLDLTDRRADDPDRLVAGRRGRLCAEGLLEAVPDIDAAGADAVRPSRVLSDFLLGAPVEALVDGRTATLSEPTGSAAPPLPLPEDLGPILDAARMVRGTLPPALVAETGSGRRDLARARLCPADRPLCEIHLDRLAEGADGPDRLQAALVAARLTGASVLVAGLAAAPSAAERAMLSSAVASGPRTVLLADTPEALRRTGILCHEITLPPLTVAARARLWRYRLDAAGLDAPDDAVSRVAEFFALSWRDVGQAVAALAAGADAGRALGEADLFAAARARSARSGTVTSPVRNGYDLNDLVVPPVLRDRIEDFIAATRHRRKVYEDWGMARRLGPARGLSALFTGSSGTGKSMAASAIARALGLELHRIELASVVSKYIGETEKNLDAAFETARAANCILFFDEADALFGKRSEVKDAHDRYANIECAYLLQKMEGHDGIVILTTNLARSLDAAFSRRIQFVIDFPRPDAALRTALWQGMFPGGVPLAEDVDFAYLARNFELTGGEIRNIALDVALRAAARDGEPITRSALVAAVERHMIKQGRPATNAAFRQNRPTPTSLAAE